MQLLYYPSLTGSAAYNKKNNIGLQIALGASAMFLSDYSSTLEDRKYGTVRTACSLVLYTVQYMTSPNKASPHKLSAVRPPGGILVAITLDFQTSRPRQS
eukprot:scaffold22574_cov125-Cylindrotheca_fusiformis.AAC.13